MCTLTPSSSNFLIICNPMPLVPPVTRTFFSEKFIVTFERILDKENLFANAVPRQFDIIFNQEKI